MRYLRLVILISMFGFGLNTTASAQCCPAGCKPSGYGNRCWYNNTTNSCGPSFTCPPTSGSGGGGSGGRQTLVVRQEPPSYCPKSYPGASRDAAINQCVAALSGNAIVWSCLFEDDAGRAEDYRTGLTCQERQRALANQCRARCTGFVETKTDCYDNHAWWPFHFGDIGGVVYGSARVGLCGPPLPTRIRGFETRPPGFHVPAPNRPFDTRPPWFR